MVLRAQEGELQVQLLQVGSQGEDQRHLVRAHEAQAQPTEPRGKADVSVGAVFLARAVVEGPAAEFFKRRGGGEEGGQLEYVAVADLERAQRPAVGRQQDQVIARNPELRHVEVQALQHAVVLR